MDDKSQQQLAKEVHASGVRAVIALTGGGSGAISTLLGQAGASRSILSAVVPYSSEALVEWLGGQPDEFCSSRTARAMAMAAFLKAAHYDPAAPVCGVACTASLASDRPKRGAHRIHVAWQSSTTTAVGSLELVKGRRSRGEEESVAAGLVLDAVAEASGVASRLELPLGDGERIEAARVTAPSDVQDLLAGRVSAVGPAGSGGGPPTAVLPGAFDPLHAAHRKMAALAEQMLGGDVAFEISIDNVDKPPLDFIEIDRRLRQFSDRQGVWLTRAATFVKKAQLFPGVTFVVGADTIERIGHQRYYDRPSALTEALKQLAAAGCRFLVFGRLAEGGFRGLDDLRLPATLAGLCRGVPEDAFREDVSSTQLRRGPRSDGAPAEEPAG